MTEHIKRAEITDQFLHERVMGVPEQPLCDASITWDHGIWCCGECGTDGTRHESTVHHTPVPRYTTSMDAAWTLLERFHSYQMVAVPKAKHFEVDVFAGNGKDTWGAVSHQSLQDAICIAALRSVGVEVEP